jgi:hypothetical protein
MAGLYGLIVTITPDDEPVFPAFTQFLALLAQRWNT